MPKIYISYRRSDSADITGRIRDFLVLRYSSYDIFTDINSIAPGADFVGAISNIIRQCSVMLVIIGPRWLQSGESDGPGRVADIVRTEIEMALSQQLLVIPVLVNGASMPPISDLPPSIGELAYRNALVVRRDPDFQFDMNRLLMSMSSAAPEVRPRSRGLFGRLFGGQSKNTPIPFDPPVVQDGPVKRTIEPSAVSARPSSLFISYKSEDRPTVSALASALSENGFAVWYDQRLMGGHLWWDEIIDNIVQRDAFIFVLTPAALDSVPCQREYRYAHALRKRILPLFLTDEVNTRFLPPELQKIQGVRLRDTDNVDFAAVLETLSMLQPAEPLPYPMPNPPEAPISPLGAIKEQLDAQTLSLEQQAVMLHQLRAMTKVRDSADDALFLLRLLAEHPDARTSITDEIRQLLG